jgi:hypothetical protein
MGRSGHHQRGTARRRALALQRIPQRKEIEIVHRCGGTRPPIPRFEHALSNQQILEQAVARLDRRATDSHEVLRAVVTATKAVRGAGRWLDEDQDPSLRVLGWKLLDQGRDRRRDAFSTTNQDGTLDLLPAVCREARAHELRKAVLVLVLLDAAHDVPATEVLQIVGERAECRDDIIHIGDVLLPFGLLVLPASQLADIDLADHDSVALMPGTVPGPRCTDKARGRRETGVRISPRQGQVCADVDSTYVRVRGRHPVGSPARRFHLGAHRGIKRSDNRRALRQWADRVERVTPSAMNMASSSFANRWSKAIIDLAELRRRLEFPLSSVSISAVHGKVGRAVGMEQHRESDLSGLPTVGKRTLVEQIASLAVPPNASSPALRESPAGQLTATSQAAPPGACVNQATGVPYLQLKGIAVGAPAAKDDAAVHRNAQRAPAVPGGTEIAAPIGGVNLPGFIDTSDGANLRTGPAEAGGKTVIDAPLPPATRVFVSGTHLSAPQWWYVTAFLTDKIVRGYVQQFRVNTDLPEPLAKLHQVKSGDTIEKLAVQDYASSVRDGHDLRYYENVLLFTNKQRGRVGITGTYQNPGLLGGGANNIQLVAGHRIWLVSPAYAHALEGAIPDGSLTNGAYAKVKRFVQHVVDIIKSITQSPHYFVEVAGEYAQVIRDHLPEIIGIIGIIAGFIAAEAASAFLAATPTGVGQIAAVLIQLALSAFGAAGIVEAGVEALKHAGQWLTLAWTAKGKEEQIGAASREFLRMLVSIAMAALAYIGVKGNLSKAVTIAKAMPPAGMVPAVAGVGGRVGPVTGAGEGVKLVVPSPAGPLGTSTAMMTKLGGEDGSGSSSAEETTDHSDTIAKGQSSEPPSIRPRDQDVLEHNRPASEGTSNTTPKTPATKCGEAFVRKGYHQRDGDRSDCRAGVPRRKGIQAQTRRSQARSCYWVRTANSWPFLGYRSRKCRQIRWSPSCHSYSRGTQGDPARWSYRALRDCTSTAHD